MKKRNISVGLAAALLIGAQLACNMPGSQSAQQTQIPAPNQTLTALFAFTPAGADATATPTLPPVVTATLQQAQPTATFTQAPPPTATLTQPPAANNPTATATRVVSAPTATVPGVRPRSQVVAKFLNTPPTLDGDWSEWKDLTTEYPAGSVVYGQANWTDDDDLDASFHAGWDNNNLYLAVKVRDDQYVQKAAGENIFKGDSIEILFDAKLQDDFFYNKLSPDDFQLGISPGNPDPGGTKEAYLWFPSNVAGTRSNVKIASRQEAGIYRVEIAIPWNVLETTPAEGRHYGFALSVSDNDKSDENVQQTMISNVSTRRLTDPTTWGDLVLQK